MVTFGFKDSLGRGGEGECGAWETQVLKCVDKNVHMCVYNCAWGLCVKLCTGSVCTPCLGHFQQLAPENKYTGAHSTFLSSHQSPNTCTCTCAHTCTHMHALTSQNQSENKGKHSRRPRPRPWAGQDPPLQHSQQAPPA